MRFGERLSIHRKKRKLTAEELSVAIGISRSYITLIENGKRMPGKAVILSLGKPLKVKTDTIINWYLEDVREQLE